MIQNNLFGLKKRVILELYSIFENIETLDKVIIFGSRARGDFKSRSDIDLAIQSENDRLTSKILGQIEESDIFLHVDVVNINFVESEKFIDNVKEQGIIFWERKK
jgi:uncharacterized protein